MACSNVRLCTEILPTGSQCKGFALRGQPWCREHATPRQRERNADTSHLISMIRNMNLFSVACTLQNTVHELRTKVIPPLHAEAILDAAAVRLEQLTEESRLAEEQVRLALAQFEHAAASSPDNSHGKNRLHAIPIK